MAVRGTIVVAGCLFYTSVLAVVYYHNPTSISGTMHVESDDGQTIDIPPASVYESLPVTTPGS